MHVSLVTLVVGEYDPAIEFFTGVLGFDLVEDSPAETSDGRPKRWVVVRPPGAETGLLLARADGAGQAAANPDPGSKDQHAAPPRGIRRRLDPGDCAVISGPSSR